jgi:choline dehydrogenase-like flavoprotein
MISDALRTDAFESAAMREYEVCIVGAGAAGITLANELSCRGGPVLLIEAGASTLADSDQASYLSESVGDTPHQGVNLGRARVFGGTTRLWGGQILPFTPLDFDRRPWVDGSGWPIPMSELTPYYLRAAEVEGLGSAIVEDSEVWRALGIAEPDLGDELETFFTRWCPQPDFAKLHADRLIERPNLTVLLNCTAVATELDGTAMRRLVCRRADGLEKHFTAREYVFCLGGIETVRFFLQPAVQGCPPWQGHPMLGAHFQDHIDADVGQLTPVNHRLFHEAFDNVYLRRHKYHPKLRMSEKGQESREVLLVTGTIRVDDPMTAFKSAAKHLLATRGRDRSSAALLPRPSDVPSLGRAVYRYLRHNRAHIPRDAPMRLRVHCEQEPYGAGRVTLSESSDAFGLRRTRIHWQIADSEIRAIAEFALLARDRLRTRGLADMLLHEDLGTPEFRARCSDSNHHMSGMRMSCSPAYGLVDPQLGVHGTRNVHVCSAAVFPTSSSSNPTHTILALALRLADRLAARRRGGPWSV